MEVFFDTLLYFSIIVLVHVNFKRYLKMTETKIFDISTIKSWVKGDETKGSSFKKIILHTVIFLVFSALARSFVTSAIILGILITIILNDINLSYSEKIMQEIS